MILSKPIRWLFHHHDSRMDLLDERGFTLVEILVSLAIMAVLFGIVSLALVGVGSGAEATINTAELETIQRAVDVHMTKNGLTSIAQRDIPDIVHNGDATWADNYLRSMPSKCSYTWTSDGEVSQVACSGLTCTTSYASLVLALLGWIARTRKQEVWEFLPG